MTTHTPNKVNVSEIRAGCEVTSPDAVAWRRLHSERSVILPMVTLLANMTSVCSLPANRVIDGISLHSFSTASPPLSRVPAHTVPLPSDFDNAIFGPFKMFWRPAYQKEIDSLFRYDVWRLERVPPGALVLPCKLVFKVKPADGNDPPDIAR